MSEQGSSRAWKGGRTPTGAKSVDREQEKALFRAALLAAEPRFDPALADRDVLNSIFAWVWRRDDFNAIGLDYDRGLWLHGSLGRGKTLALQGLRRYLIGLRARHREVTEGDWRTGTLWTSASEMANAYATGGLDALRPFIAPDSCLTIDELGREPNPASHYGTRMDAAQFVLQVRYDHRRRGVTHVTTNLDIEDIAGRYGDYVADRCKEMFNFIELQGDSLRQ